MKLELLMKIPERRIDEGLAAYAQRLSELYSKTYSTEARKHRGQFFTPEQVSAFMVSLFGIPNKTIRLLDPGAGTGILTAAFCERLLNNGKTENLTIDVYENDPNILPFLTMVLESCKSELEYKGLVVEYNIYETDYVLHNKRYFTKSDLMWNGEKPVSYDFIISNPPYYKIDIESPQAIVMNELISGQPNIYALFMALSASMLNADGEMVFITPRSFCSGLYYKKFRQWFLRKAQITNIHIFESRKEIFDQDEVLQENIIIKAKKLKISEKPNKITISESKNKHFTNISKLEVRSEDVIFRKNGDIFIRIPTSPLDIEILHVIDSWPNTLKELGLEISTGPVVSFRAEEYLLPELTEIPASVPLLWMHNMKDMSIVSSIHKEKKASAIQVSSETKHLLLPVKNYVLVKRFSSKEQKRRLYASVLLESEFPHKNVGIENHVNYIHKPGGNLSVIEAFGIASLLNTTIIDKFFRSLNGNTQVNATDIRSLPLPDIENIRKIGKAVYESASYKNGIDLDGIIAGILGLNFEKQSLNR
ncbi:MAG: Eco57I restriction-modification methylase domain-containing protein [Candidatus Methanoperedens sp.]|nr:Eco57I restriction-modification methylase domain-containing protein [Candidatus Methanoperedens sp.]